MVVFGAAGSVPKTSRAFVVVVLGFFCSVCRDERNESIFFALLRRRRAFCSAATAPACSACRAALEAPEFAAIVYKRLRRVIIRVLPLRKQRIAMSAA